MIISNPEISKILSDSGALTFGFAPAHVLNEKHLIGIQQWLDKDFNAGMEYMKRYEDLRMNPQLLLENCRTVISLAFNYNPEKFRNKNLAQIASFAYGEDYHIVMRERLQKCVDKIKEKRGGDWRICVDSAPVFERAWAEICGIGRCCDNGLIAVKGAGTRILLAEILSSLPGEYYSNSGVNTYGLTEAEEMCLHCGKCTRACPTGALQTDSTVDARKCLSYLSIEHKGDFTDYAGDYPMPLFGCDICQNVCPLNNPAMAEINPTNIPEFKPIQGCGSFPDILEFDAQDAIDMSQETFSKMFKKSPVKRTKLIGLQRNAIAYLMNN